ncbi:hypothetical protein B0H11DRAFT_1924031 [Mycena galericulata]|nr:hypothetical protein B0H11DRAFT_1928736 [Mycena galericulata]KAJ7460437.1 hypothetical protein B0H11DRAFT_1924031 [Mycena galericulata]
MAYLPPNSTAIIMPPSASDRPGGFYTYFDPTFSIAKMGRSNDPARRKLEWARQCRGEAQIWLPFYWEVPFAAKFERLIHHHYQRAGAWLGPVRCTFCGVNHREKYWFHGYSELIRFIMTVEHYLGVLAKSADTPPTPSGGRGRLHPLVFDSAFNYYLDRSKNPHVCFWLREGEGAGAGGPGGVPASLTPPPLSVNSGRGSEEYYNKSLLRSNYVILSDEAVPEVGKGSPGGTPLAAPAGTP